jgi:hypothetical protein
VRRYQDSKDKGATSNLKTHAVRCFGEDVVEAAFGTKPTTEKRDGSIFASFARQGQAPVKVTHRAHTSDETRAHLARWCVENSCPTKIVSDQEFVTLMKAGRPSTVIPSPATVRRDIKAIFEHCRERIDNILKKHAGHLNFATDAWTSPNHRAFVGWTVHLPHEGHLLSFLLDVVKVTEVSSTLIIRLASTDQVYLQSHTGATLAREFHNMLVRHGLEQKILSFTADNASNNTTQAEELDSLDNSFELVNRIGCFNHTMQLSAKALLKPFRSNRRGDQREELEEEGNGGAELPSDDEADDGESDDSGADDEDGPDLFEELDEDEQEELVHNTEAVAEALQKVRLSSSQFAHWS